MTSFDSSQVNIHAGKTASLGVALAENERTSGQQQQGRRNDKKQFFHRRNLQFKYSVPSWDAKNLTLGRNPGRAHRFPQSGSPRQRASLVCSPWLPHFRWVVAVKAQPVRTLAGSAVDAPASAGLDCGQPAEYVPRKGSTTVKAVSDRDGESLYRAVRFIFLVRVCGEIARSMLPPIFCAMS